MWINRIIEKSVLNAAASRPAVLITGARQTGKSSLLRTIFPSIKHCTLDRPAFAQAAKESPGLFIDDLGTPVMIDEIQYAPELFREIKPRIDQHRDSFGSYILTGSQRFELMAGVGESLAGRIRIIELNTLCAQELRQAELDASQYLWKGGYPELWANPALKSDEFFEDYIATYLERDLHRILNVSSIRDFRRFILACAVRVGQLINFSDLGRDIGITTNTIKSWINTLDASGLIHILPPYHANIGKRLTKAPKLYFADHGLLCHLLNIHNHEQWHQHPQKGSLWENLVLSEYIKTHGYKPGLNLFFYRDQNGVEIDFVIEAEGKIKLVEAKASERPEPQKLHFNKVAPLFSSAQVETCLACQMQSETSLMMKDYRMINPLLHGV